MNGPAPAPAALDLWQSVPGQETAKRAIEIALVGGHGVELRPRAIGDYPTWTPYDLQRLTGAARHKAQAYCDRFSDGPRGIEAARAACEELRRAADDLASLCGVPPVPFEPAGPLVIEVQGPSMADYMLPPPAEPAAPVARRINAARRILPDISAELDHNAAALLKMWRDCVPVDDATAAAFQQVARSIAALDPRRLYPLVNRLALAESLSYHRGPQ